MEVFCLFCPGNTFSKCKLLTLFPFLRFVEFSTRHLFVRQKRNFVSELNKSPARGSFCPATKNATFHAFTLFQNFLCDSFVPGWKSTRKQTFKFHGLKESIVIPRRKFLCKVWFFKKQFKSEVCSFLFVFCFQVCLSGVVRVWAEVVGGGWKTLCIKIG